MFQVHGDLGDALYHLARLHSKRGESARAAEALEQLVALTRGRRGRRGEPDPAALENVKKLALALDEVWRRSG